jgi:hypothetical protein
MKDDRGLYYYPYPHNKQTRMYVRKSQGIIWFRLFNENTPELWDEHGWVPHDAIIKAAAMYDRKNSAFNPTEAYDPEIAKALIKDEELYNPPKNS